MEDIRKAIFSGFWKNLGYTFLFLLASILLIALLVPKGIFSFFKWMFENAIRGLVVGIVIIVAIGVVVFIILKIKGFI